MMAVTVVFHAKKSDQAFPRKRESSPWWILSQGYVA